MFSTLNSDLPFESVGGKAHNLIHLIQEGISVPRGYLITTETFQQFLQVAVSESRCIGDILNTNLEFLSSLNSGGSSGEIPLDSVKKVSSECREFVLEHLTEASEILLPSLLDTFGTDSDSDSRYAIRSSGVAEDLPEFSFAGQMDTFLNVPVHPLEGLVRTILRCWASLFSERALMYRFQHDVEQTRFLRQEEDVEEEGEIITVRGGVGSRWKFPLICVVVQEMVEDVFVSGVGFSADPLTESRDLIVINAAWGLGEAIVSGLATPDTFSFRKSSREIVETQIGAKEKMAVAIHSEELRDDDDSEWVRLVDVEEEDRCRLCLTPAEVLRLVDLILVIERSYGGTPQDVEFAFRRAPKGELQLYILQSRPITRIRPLPEKPKFFFQNQAVDPNPGPQRRVLACLNHLQVVSGPVRPLGQSVVMAAFNGCFEALRGNVSDDVTASGNSRFFVFEGRLYLDIGDFIAGAPECIASRLIDSAEDRDLYLGKGLRLLYERGFFGAVHPMTRLSFCAFLRLIWNGARILRFGCPAINYLYFMNLDTAKANVSESLRGIRLVDEDLAGLSPPAALRRVFDLIGEKTLSTFFANLPFMAASSAAETGYERLASWCRGSRGLEEIERGMLLHSKRLERAIREIAWIVRQDSGALLGVLQEFLSDESRTDWRISSVVEFVRDDCGVDCESFVLAMERFESEWGFRGVSEFDATNKRFRDDCSFVLRSVVSRNESESPDDESEMRRGDDAIETLVQHERASSRCTWWNVLTCGIGKIVRSCLVRRYGQVYRSLFAFREDPKHILMQMFEESVQITRRRLEKDEFGSLLVDQDDFHYLYIEEIVRILDHAADMGDADLRSLRKVIEIRKQDHIRWLQDNGVPHVITSFGENVDISVSRELTKDLPPSFLLGQGVSLGRITGIARIIIDPRRQTIRSGEIIVAKQIDPTLSTLFSRAGGLVSEVGGTMSHGSIVAREVGIPAVVSVRDACSRIDDGQFVTVDGYRGTVEIA